MVVVKVHGKSDDTAHDAACEMVFHKAQALALGMAIVTATFAGFRRKYAEASRLLAAEGKMKMYSLRRGGACHQFSSQGSLDPQRKTMESTSSQSRVHQYVLRSTRTGDCQHLRERDAGKNGRNLLP